jgi:hypothetical protein
MNFWQYVWRDIDASNPIERFWSFIGGLFGMGLMRNAMIDIIGGGLYIFGLIIGVIK